MRDTLTLPQWQLEHTIASIFMPRNMQDDVPMQNAVARKYPSVYISRFDTRKTITKLHKEETHLCMLLAGHWLHDQISAHRNV